MNKSNLIARCWCLLIIALTCSHSLAAPSDAEQTATMREELKGKIFYGKNYPAGWNELAYVGGPHELFRGDYERTRFSRYCDGCSVNALARVRNGKWHAMLALRSDQQRVDDKVLSRYVILDVLLTKSEPFRHLRGVTDCLLRDMLNEDQFKRAVYADVYHNFARSKSTRPTRIYSAWELDFKFGLFSEIGHSRFKDVICTMADS